MARFNFNLREPKSSTPTQIFLIIRWDKKRLVYPINESIKPEYWETDKTKSNFQRAKNVKAFPTSPEFNLRLDNILTSAKNIFRQYQNENKQLAPTKSEYKELLDIHFNKSVVEEINLFSFYQNHIDLAKTRYSIKTVQWYELSLKVLKEFSKTYKRALDFDNIDMTFYDAFIDYLTNVKGLKQNTIGKHIQNLKAVLNSATERGINKRMDFKSRSFKKTTENSSQIHLTENEINEMYNLDLSNDKRLERVRDLFIVGCCTGLRYSDFSKIRKENIVNGYINLDVNKTKQQGLIVPIHPFVEEIMLKYKNNENHLPNTISDDKMRVYLKEIGQMIPSLNDYFMKSYMLKGKRVEENVKKYELIGTHTARRSFATNMYKEDNGIDNLTIMAITGHKTEKSFMTYLKTTNQEHALKIKQHWENKYGNNLKAI